jgi:glyoxylase-like metal-dependent hydrolase (beta-lactamase superfamily II)
MKQVAPQIYTFDGLIGGRVYLLEDEDGLTIVDTSINSAGNKIIAQLKEAGHKPEDVKRILITHAHPDHVGGLPIVKAETGAEVWSHELEKPVIQGEMPIARPEGGMRVPETRFPMIPVARTLQDKDHLPILGGLQVIFTPGHAPGHISFWQEERRLLITGDVIFYLLNRMTQPLRMLTPDPKENRRSIKKLYDLQPESLLFGHGVPIVGNAMATLEPFVKRLGLI